MMDFRQADILAYTLRTGDAVSNHTFDLARALGRRGVAVRIWVNHPLGPVPEDIAPLVHQIHYADYPGGADLVMLQYPLWFPLAERFREAAGAKLFWYHGVTPPHLWPARERDLLRNGEVRTELAWFADVVAADSPFVADELHRHSGYPREQIRVTPLGIDAASFAQVPPPEELNALRSRWQLDQKRVLLYVGRVAGNKRIDLTIRALAHLLPDFPDLHLLVVGDTQDGTVTQALTAQLQQLAQELGVAQAVTFTGRVERAEPYFHLAEVYVQASDHEGFGVPLVEAMAAGLPVVASASGSMPWLLGADDGTPSGLLFTPGSSDELARRLSRLLADATLRAALVAQGRARAADFAPDRFDAAVGELLAAVAAAQEERQNRRSDDGPLPFVQDPLFRQADVALRSYRTRSHLPLVGRLVEWVRVNSMSHFKEAYLDRVIEQQVNFNRLAARDLIKLRAEIDELRRALAEMDGPDPTGPTPCE